MSKSYVVRERTDGTRYFDENTPTGQISPDTIGDGLKISADGKLIADVDALSGDFVKKSGDTMTGALEVPTPALTESSTKVATTAWVKSVLPNSNGFKTNPDGSVSVDFNQMDEDTKNTLRKELGVLIYLEQETNFYVNGATGSDTLDEGRGLSEDKPFKTIQACVDYVSTTYNLGKYDCYINVAAGTYNEKVTCASYSSTSGIMRIIGAGKNTTNISVDHTSSIPFSVINGGVWYVSDLTVEKITDADNSTPWGIVFYVSSKAEATLKNVEIRWKNNVSSLSRNSLRIVNVSGNAQLTLSDGMSFISDDARTSPSGYVIFVEGSSLSTISGEVSQTETNATVSGKANTFIIVSGGTYGINAAYAYKLRYTGSFTGKRYNVINGGKVNTSGEGESYFPGTTAGTMDSGTYSWYK